MVRPARVPLMAENTFIPPTPGRLVLGGTGERYFVFDRASDGTRLPAVVLMPCLELGALERLVAQTGAGAAAADSGGAGAATRVLISGQVFVYRGRNYMMLAAPPMLERVQVPVAASPVAPAAPSGAMPAGRVGSASGAGAAGEDDPEAAELIAELEREAGPRRSVTNAPAPVGASAAGGSTVGTVGATVNAAAGSGGGAFLRAVAPLVLRRGRLVRGPQGSWLFAPDSGAGNPGEPPLVVLPCLNLQAMEATAERLGESAAFLLSGEVSSYQGRNFVLPRLFFVDRTSGNLTPVQ